MPENSVLCKYKVAKFSKLPKKCVCDLPAPSGGRARLIIDLAPLQASHTFASLACYILYCHESDRSRVTLGSGLEVPSIPFICLS